MTARLARSLKRSFINSESVDDLEILRVKMAFLFREIAENVPCPHSSIQTYIFHSKDDANAETIVERMLAYKPIQL